MLVSSDIKFISEIRNSVGMPRLAESVPRLINLISKDTHVVFYLLCIISRFDGENK